ncbi:MAG: basic amino acid ABC transporter substrate-binding protein [Nitrospinales bacterium]
MCNPKSNRFSLIPIIFLGFLFISACGESSKPEQVKKLVVGLDATLIPMSFMTDGEVIDGFEPDLIKAIGKEIGVEMEIKNVEWAGLFGGLITGKYDAAISSITILEERKKRMAFSIPYLKSGLALVIPKEVTGINSLEDIRSKNLLVGAQVGTTAYFFLEKKHGVRKKGYQMYGHAVTDMINDQIDAVIGESTGTLYYKNQNEDYFKKIKMVGEIMTKEFYGIAIRKDDPGLLKKINIALEALNKNGTLKILHNKWDLGQAASVPNLNEENIIQ